MRTSYYAALSCLTVVVLTAPLAAEVRSLTLPAGARVPDVAQDAGGVIHATYGTGLPGDGCYIRSADGGKTFSTPVKLNQRGGTVTTGMERGPKLALGKDGVIHVVWLAYYKKGGGAWYTRSTDGGKSFAPERALQEPDYGLDNATIVADGRGLVLVLWTGGFPGITRDPDSPTASPIILVRSTDDGATFSKNELLPSDHPASSHACGCCRLEARLAGDHLYVGFRGGYKNLRDPWILVGPKTGNAFRCVRISEDNWSTTCPMQGIPFSVSDKGRVLVSWMSREQAYWSWSDAAVKQFATRIVAPAGKGTVSFPLALPASKDEVFLLWQQGKRAYWALVRENGAPTGERGALAASPDGHRATAFVGRDGHIYVAR
jgi:hypothetical protein